MEVRVQGSEPSVTWTSWTALPVLGQPANRRMHGSEGVLRVAHPCHVPEETELSCLLLPLIQTRRLRFFGHVGVARMSDSQDTFRAMHTSIRGLPKDWKRRPGRPRHTWLQTLNADLHPLNHGLNSAWRHAQDRERWRQLVETATLQSGACP